MYKRILSQLVLVILVLSMFLGCPLVLQAQEDPRFKTVLDEKIFTTIMSHKGTDEELNRKVNELVEKAPLEATPLNDFKCEVRKQLETGFNTNLLKHSFPKMNNDSFVKLLKVVSALAWRSNDLKTMRLVLDKCMKLSQSEPECALRQLRLSCIEGNEQEAEVFARLAKTHIGNHKSKARNAEQAFLENAPTAIEDDWKRMKNESAEKGVKLKFAGSNFEFDAELEDLLSQCGEDKTRAFEFKISENSVSEKLFFKNASRKGFVRVTSYSLPSSEKCDVLADGPD